MTLLVTRNLGPESGIQMNPIRDNSDYPVANIADQVFAIAGKFKRGRIDKAFTVTQSNQARMLGNGGSIAADALNEARVQVYVALSQGATSAVIARLHQAAAKLQLISVKSAETVDDVFSVGDAAAAGSLLSIKHKECFSDGIFVDVHAVEVLDDEDKAIASKLMKLRLRDPLSNELLFPEFVGSLDPLAKDAYEQSIYLPDIVSASTDLVDVTVMPGVSVPANSVFYGPDSSGAEKFASKLLLYFTEGTSTYAPADHDRACLKLKRSEASYGYIASGGTQDASLITKLIALGYQVNKQVRWDISGKLTPEQAVNFYKTVGGTDSLYSQCYWAPLLATDPLNGGKAVFGAAGDNIGLACGRNARTDTNGVAPKNWPVAGSDFPLSRSGVTQIHDIDEDDLKLLAKHKINPVFFVDYASGSRYVFFDSLTGVLNNVDSGLIAVADMATSVDDDMARFAKECLQKPMEIAIKRMTDFAQSYFEAIETANWIKPSAELGNRAFVAQIQPSPSNPKKDMVLSYWLSYDGTARAIYQTQTISK